MLEKQGCSQQNVKARFFAIRFFYIHIVGFKQEDFSFYKPKIEFKIPVVLSQPEVSSLLSNVYIEDYKLALSLIYQCGLRISEAINLKNEDINGKETLKTITVRNAKGNKDRVVPLPDDLYWSLRKYWPTHRNQKLLFPKKRSHEIGFNRSTTEHCILMRTLQTVIKIAAKEACIIKKVSCHTLRHSYATHLLEAGVSIFVLKELLGHSNIRSTMVYLHITRAMERETLRIINQGMKKL